MTEEEARRFIERLNDANYDLQTRLVTSMAWNVIQFIAIVVLFLLVIA